MLSEAEIRDLKEKGKWTRLEYQPSIHNMPKNAAEYIAEESFTDSTDISQYTPTPNAQYY